LNSPGPDRRRPTDQHPGRRHFAELRGPLSSYGMLGVLLLLCLLFSILTLRSQHPAGEGAARAIAKRIGADAGPVLIVARGGEEDARFARSLAGRLTPARMAGMVTGDPAALRAELTRSTYPADLTIVTLDSYEPTVRAVLESFPALARATVITPPSYRWPTFLLGDNLRNVANQIAVIAIVAVGMTMVILTGGIDLSVGSLIALAAVAATGVIGHLGGEGANGAGMLAGALVAILVCGAFGAFSGLTVTRFRVPPFIATLAVMQVASGIAYIISKGRPIYRVPDSFVALGRGADPIVGIPYAVILMGALFIAAHLLMSRTTLGRYIYAVGGNSEAARLAGVRVNGILMFTYVASAALAGLGGVIMASQLKSGAPTYGLSYELYVIAAVVVGGTSLSGGEGRILGTLIGAFIIAVIQNGMNLTNVESYTQKVILGLVILGAVLLDRLKHQGIGIWQRRGSGLRPRGAAGGH
jgi:ribose transport system permease protein